MYAIQQWRKAHHAAGEFFSTAEQHALAEPADFVTALKASISRLQAVPTTQHSVSHKVYKHKNLQTCAYMFIRHDTVLKPFQLPYNGPFQVIQWSSKHFTLNINGHEKVISLNRLKPAYIDPTDHTIPPQISHSSHSTITTPLYLYIC